MDSRERRAAIDRDGFECQHCGTIDVLADDGGLEAHAVGPTTPGSATRHSLVTVCGDCADWLEESAPVSSRDVTDAELFQAVRTLTRAQAAAVSDAGEFATAATSLPNDLESNAERAYPADRRALLLTLDVVDARLEAVATVDRSSFDVTVCEALDAFLEEAGTLQAQLRTVVGVVAVLASALERCHVCLAELEAGVSCSRCETAPLDVDDLRDADGAIRFDAVQSVIGDSLEETSKITDRVVERTTVLAEALVG
ncbi:hypothetical protein [Natronobeatus ordinarius]|uniref:hypothetical protein n=1 Tax=Natronobeatus ordinarius TaxID=2963433 RepID=UPI0020CBA2E0|nr:hypothetical protein [Natronobeatus ordinarius]